MDMIIITYLQQLVHFLDTNFYVGSIALLVGVAAYSVYARQKRDAKRDAANIVLLEVENAEQQIQKINETSREDPVAPGIYLMKNASWNERRYLFVRDFDRNEWDNINDFYNKCRLFDEAVEHHGLLFEKNMSNIRDSLQWVLATYASEYAQQAVGKNHDEKAQLEKDYVAKRKQFIGAYMNTDIDHMYTHYPVKPINEAKAVLDNIEASLSLTSVGIKLKRMSSKTSLWSRAVLAFRGK